jgi:simple sugar transport system permease protein
MDSPSFGAHLWRVTRARFGGNNFLLLITIILFAGMYLFGSVVYSSKNFGTLNSFFDMLNSNSALIVLAAGMTMVLISGGIDISVGAQIAMYCMMFAYFMEHQFVNAYVMILVVLITGIVFGLIQGVLVAYFDIQPFIVTLAGMFLARGMTAMISPQTISITNKDFMALAKFQIKFPFGGYTNAAGVYQQPFIYLHVVLALVALIALYMVMTWSKFGRSVYAVGGSEQSAKLMGLNVRRTKMMVYVVNGFLAAFAGFLFCLFSPGGAVEKAPAYEMYAIAAAVIGGAMFTGGVGNILGSVFGVLVQSTIIKFVNFNGTLSNGWPEVIRAAIMSFFIILQSVFTYVRKRRE